MITVMLHINQEYIMAEMESVPRAEERIVLDGQVYHVSEVCWIMVREDGHAVSRGPTVYCR